MAGVKIIVRVLSSIAPIYGELVVMDKSVIIPPYNSKAATGMKNVVDSETFSSP